MIIEIFLIFIAFSTICHSQPTPPPLVRNIAVGIGVSSPFVEKYPDISRSTISLNYRGFLIDVLNELRSLIGFTYQLVENDDLTIIRNGSGFGGQISDLINGRTQIAAGPFYQEEIIGNQPFEFTIPYTINYGLGLLMKDEGRGKLKVSYPNYTLFMDYILNLDSNVWGVITACYIVACFLWFLVDRITGCCGPRHTYNEWSLIAKFTFTNWLLFFVIVTALIVDDENYYANLRSDNVHNEIKSFDDIGKNTASVRILMISNSRAARYLQGVADIEQRYFDSQLESVYRKPLPTITVDERNRLESLVPQKWSWLKNTNGSFVRNIDEAKEILLRFPNTIFVAFCFLPGATDTLTMYCTTGDQAEVKYAALSNCTFTYAETSVNAQPMVIALPRNPQMKQAFDSAIQRLRDNRKLDQLQESWFEQNPYTLNCGGVYGSKTQLHRLGWLFAALCISAALSLAVALVVGGLFAAIESCCKLCFRHKDKQVITVQHEPIVMVQRNGM